MTKEMQIQMLETRLDKIAGRPEATKTPGVMRKMIRKINKLKNV